MLVIVYLLVVIVACAATSARAASSPWPAWWYSQAMCIHRHESTDWHRRTNWLGYPSRDHGGMQIDVGTWASYRPAGYPPDPAAASPGQQLYVAWLIWLANGHRFGGHQWPLSSRLCGVR